MSVKFSAPVLITGGARRIGLALTKDLLHQQVPVIVGYRTEYPILNTLRQQGAICIQGDLAHNQGVYQFAARIKEQCPKLRAIIHNASTWEAESTSIPPEQTMATMLQIHVYAPYLLNQLLETCLRGQPGTDITDIIHITDYVVDRGSDKHIAYAASKAALDNMTRSFAQKLAPHVKVNAVAPAMIMFNANDDAAYRQKALDKSLMKIEPGEQEVINAINYLLQSRYVTGRTLGVDGGRPLR